VGPPERSVTPEYWLAAKRALARSDPVLGGIIRSHPRVALARRGEPFFTLARSIVGQQISVKAAQSVWERLLAIAPDMLPEEVLPLDAARLRSCGLSERKTEYLHGLASQFCDGGLRVADWSSMDDEAVIRDLLEVRGIGRWTAEMFLIFSLLRPDVLPLEDLGLQKAIQLNYFEGRKVSESRMRKIARPWSPWRSVATWYLWRSLDPVPVEY
jgi:DNA-3-methyladenine glycosylase II